MILEILVPTMTIDIFVEIEENEIIEEELKPARELFKQYFIPIENITPQPIQFLEYDDKYTTQDYSPLSDGD